MLACIPFAEKEHMSEVLLVLQVVRQVEESFSNRKINPR